MSGIQFWPIIAVMQVSALCEFGREVGLAEDEEPCTALATAHGDLVGINPDGGPEEIHLHLCARHYDILQSGQTEVWVKDQ